MVKRKKVTRKQLKQPDEFITVTEHAILFLRNHGKKIMTAGVVLLVLVVSFVIYRMWAERREVEAHRRLNLALEAYQLASSPYREGTPSEERKLLETFDEIGKAYPHTSSGKIASLYKGNIHLKLGAYDPAVQAYEAFLSAEREEKLYRLLALNGLGDAYEGKKEYEKAIATFQRILSQGESFQSSEATLKIARCYEKLGRKKEAVENYQAFLKGAPKSLMANAVLRKISLLEK